MPRSTRFIAALASMFILPPMVRAQSGERPQVMVVGVAHFDAHADVHDASWGSSVFSPGMQRQIARIIDALAKFKPNKVMIEAQATNPVFVQRYEAYRRGQYRLGANEDYQFGYRLAASLGLPTIFPIDSTGNFPFDYDGLQAQAAELGQTSILEQAKAETAGLVRRQTELSRASNLIGLMRYLNTADALRANAAWYLYADLIGNGSSRDVGLVLASNWYARNLQIFTNIGRDLLPGDRVIVFIGQGHAAMLRPMIDHAPFLRDVDPESYLPLK